MRVIVPDPPGGATDLLACWAGRELSPRLGKPVVVENRLGASGIIGSRAATQAAPDRHTLLWAWSRWAARLRRSMTTSRAGSTRPAS